MADFEEIMADEDDLEGRDDEMDATCMTSRA